MKSLTHMRGVAIGGALTLFHASAALAYSGPGENTPLHLSGAGTTVKHAASGGSASIIRTIVGLAVVIGVIYGVAWILRQSKAAKTRPLGQGLQQVANLPLGNGRSVALIRAGTELVLVGVAEHGVTKLRTFTEEEALEVGLGPDPDYEDQAQVVETPIQRAVDALRRMTVR